MRRWPWSRQPGMVRVGKRDLIELQRSALRAADLEAEALRVQRERAVAGAGAQACRLLEERRRVHGLDLSEALQSELLEGLPLTEDGRLHEAAFLALLEARVMWERELVAVLEDGYGDAR